MGISILLACLFSLSAQTQQKSPVATVDGVAITEAELEPFVAGELRRLRNEEYEVKKRALSEVIAQRVLAAEAKKRGVAVEMLLAMEADSKAGEPTEAEVQALYDRQKDRIGKPLAEVKEKVRGALRQGKVQQARQDYVLRLRAAAKVSIDLRPPRTEVAVDARRIRGNVNAPVTIVEFSDFQCGFCKRGNDTLMALMRKYGEKVRIAFRDFPLDFHERAAPAAEASRCAAEQGKFWQYHDVLFSKQVLTDAALAEHAKSAGLEMGQFEQCFKSGKHRAAVAEDAGRGGEAGDSGDAGILRERRFSGGGCAAGVV